MQVVDLSGNHYALFCTFRGIRTPHATYSLFILRFVCKYVSISTVKKAEMSEHEDGEKESNETHGEVNT
jgi:hypothetical protein